MRFCTTRLKIAPSGWGISSVDFLILKSACGSCATPLPGSVAEKQKYTQEKKFGQTDTDTLIKNRSFPSKWPLPTTPQNGARGQPQPPQIRSPIRTEIVYHLRSGFPAPNRPHHAREGLGDRHRQGSQTGTYFLGRRGY